ncbi:MAG: ABC transporter permease subunit [Clostridia bacterium]|nr:ABC transporter permease subunit [Clostridia bacterium]
MDNNYFEHISKEKFEFQQLNADLHDKKLETKSRGYFADAMLRFKKNKSSVVAAWILLFLVIFSIVSPIISPNHIDDMNATFTNHPPFIKSIADKGWGIFDGAYIHESQSEMQKQKWEAIGVETGLNPIIQVVDTSTQREKYRGRWREVTFYKLENNKYYERGVVYRTLSYDDFKELVKFQDDTGIQVLYPYVEPKDIMDIKDNSNIWYQVKDAKGTPKLDAKGNFIPAYSTNQEMADLIPYDSLRIESDPGDYIYYFEKSGAVHVRVCYFNYYQYEQWKANDQGEFHEPMYIFGTNSLGQCMFTAIGVGARFSLIFAVIVSAINLTIGAIYGAIQGYYGGMLDMVLDRISDILSGVPFVVVTTLFQLHLAQKVGIVPSFLFAFVLTGWIGMAALTRKQFYRFKSQEFVLAARTLGASDWRLMFKHIFPNSLGTIITSCALVIPGVISSEVSMTYLGIINLQEAFGTSIGTLASQGQTAMTSAPHAMLFPSIFISLLLISFNLFGNGLRDAFNPATRGVDD